MNKSKAERAQSFIDHILTAISRIETYVAELDQSAFERSTLVQDAVIRNLALIGEAAHKLQLADPSFLQRHTGLRLDLAYRMRNALIHGYDSVNLVTVWNTIQDDLPLLKRQLTDVAKA